MSSPTQLVSDLKEALRGFASAAQLGNSIPPASPAEVFKVAEEVDQKFLLSSPAATKFSQTLSPCLESIDRFSSVIDSFAQSDPNISTLVWGSLKLLLQVALSSPAHLTKLAEVFEEFGQFFPVISGAESFFLRSPIVQAAVVPLYIDIIQFSTQAVKVIKKRKPRDSIFRTVPKLSEDDYSQVLKNYQTHRTAFQALAITTMEMNAKAEVERAIAAREAANAAEEAAKLAREATNEAQSRVELERKESAAARREAEAERITAEEERKRATLEKRRADSKRTAAQKKLKEAVMERQRAESAREDLRRDFQRREKERKKTLVENDTGRRHYQLFVSKFEGPESDLVMRWLSPPDYDDTLSQILEQRHTGTLLWIQEHRDYISWRRHEDWKSEILWIYGESGAGKSILAGTIVEDLNRLYAGQTLHGEKPYGVCFFFFQSNNVLEKPEAMMLRAMVVQLLHQARNPELLGPIYRSRVSAHATLSELREAFSALTTHFVGIYVVVDGLDKTSDETWDELEPLYLLLTLFLHVSPVMKLLALSRPHSGIELSLNRNPRFELTGEITKADVRRTVVTWVHRTCVEIGNRVTDHKLNMEIVNALLAKSPGGWLWPTIQIKYLKSLQLPADKILGLVHHLNSRIADTYAQILTEINSGTGEARLLAKEILHWTVCARRPLKMTELSCALIILIGEEELYESQAPTETQVFKACGALLSRGRNGLVTLAHSTVAEVLLRSSNRALCSEDTHRYFIRAELTHKMIAAKCVSYLMMRCFKNRISRSKTPASISAAEIAKFPLLEYSTSNWWRHVVQSSVSKVPAMSLVDLIFKLAKSTQGLSWMEISITLSQSVSHFPTITTQVGAWLDRLEFVHEDVGRLKLWLQGLTDLANVWGHILIGSPFELRSVVRKFGRENQFFSHHFGSEDVSDMKQLPQYFETDRIESDPRERNTFDILIDEEEGYVLHPSGKLRFHFTWYLQEGHTRNSLIYIVYVENPTRRRSYKELEFSHDIFCPLPPAPLFGLQSVVFSPGWKYMAVATVESMRSLPTSGEGPGIRIFLWRIGDPDKEGDEIISELPWTSKTIANDGKSYGGYVGHGGYDAFRGSRSAIAFRRVQSTLVLQTAFGAFDVITGDHIEEPDYLLGIVSNQQVTQCTFTPDGGRVAIVKNNSQLETNNIDGSDLCETKFPTGVCEILATSPTGRFIAIGHGESAASSTSPEEVQWSLLILDSIKGSLEVVVQGTPEIRFDEVSFGLHGWLSWDEWAEEGKIYNIQPGGLAPVRPDRHSTQVYSVWNWVNGGKSSNLYISTETDYPLDPHEQRWDLPSLPMAKRELFAASITTYLFSDRTIRLDDGSFLLSVGFSAEDDHVSILTSHQTILLPSSQQVQSFTSEPKQHLKQETTQETTIAKALDLNHVQEPVENILAAEGNSVVDPSSSSQISDSSAPSTPCAVCGKPGRRCTRCLEVAYCGIEHQREDWKKHKSTCK